MIERLLEAAREAQDTPVELSVPPDWKPTPEAIRALPEPLRRYIADLHTRTDPTCDTQLIWHQRDLIEQLTAKIVELQRELAERD